MPNLTSNIVLYATLAARYPVVNMATATAANTNTLLITAAATGTIITDVLFRSLDGTARIFEIILCATGSQAVAENAILQVSIPANSGSSTIAIGSLKSLAANIFDLDLAGNLVLTLEAGQSLYVRNTTLTAGAFYIRTKARDY